MSWAKTVLPGGGPYRDVISTQTKSARALEWFGVALRENWDSAWLRNKLKWVNAGDFGEDSYINGLLDAYEAMMEARP